MTFLVATEESLVVDATITELTSPGSFEEESFNSSGTSQHSGSETGTSYREKVTTQKLGIHVWKICFMYIIHVILFHTQDTSANEEE